MNDQVEMHGMHATVTLRALPTDISFTFVGQSIVFDFSIASIAKITNKFVNDGRVDQTKTHTFRFEFWAVELVKTQDIYPSRCVIVNARIAECRSRKKIDLIT